MLEDIPREDQVANAEIEKSGLPFMMELGVQWNAEKDVFTFSLQPLECTVRTKRRFVEQISTLFDPLQMLAPFTIQARMAMQETWLRGLHWDDELPDGLKVRCQK